MSRIHPRACISSLVLALVLVAAPAYADATLTLAKTATEPALSVLLTRSGADKPASLAYASCASTPCAPDRGNKLSVDARFDAQKAQLTQYDTPAGTRLAWLSVPSVAGGSAYEIVLAPGQVEPLFAGETRAVDDAQTTTERLLRRDVGGKTLLVHSSTPPGGGLCGMPSAPGAIRAWDGRKWTSAALGRIDAESKQRATVLEASAAARSASHRYLQPSGGSDESFGRGMVDFEPRTAWIEGRSGDGAGEYASFRLDPALAVRALTVTLSPSAPPPGYAAPKSFFVSLEGHLYRVSVPAKAPSTLQLTLPAPVHSACLSIVLDEANASVPAPRSVGIAELGVIAALDGETESALLARLGDADAAKADEALATLLGMPGDHGAIWKKVYDALTPSRRRKLEDSLAGRGCAESTQLAALALGDADKDARARAVHKLEQCRKESVPALLAVLDSASAAGEQATRAGEAGRLLALLAPSVAQKELPPRLGREETRAVLWPALGKAFRSADAEAVHAALLAAPTPQAKLDVILASGDRQAEAGPEGGAVIREAIASKELPLRYRAVEPALRSADPALIRALQDDAEPSVRHRALSLMALRPHANAFDVPAQRMLADENPRVRAAAADYFRAHPQALAVAAQSLFPAAADPWPFVRMSALRAVAGAPLAVKQRALPTVKQRLEDKSFDVRRAALVAMTGMPAEWVRDDILARLDDEQEALPVRVEAARALGAVCSRADLDRLTVLAEATLTPMAFELEREVGLAAIEALGMIHPADLQKRLSPLRSAKAPVTLKAAADRAFTAAPRCTPSK